jgi:hypothetical protein
MMRITFLTWIIRERTPSLTPALSLSEGEGVVAGPSPPEGAQWGRGSG